MLPARRSRPAAVETYNRIGPVVQPEMIDVLPYLLVLGTSVWVYVDARNLGIHKTSGGGFFNMGPLGWCLSCLLLWAVAFPAYLLRRRKHLRAMSAPPLPDRAEPKDSDLMSQLGTLADLYSDGQLTEDEFRMRKRALVHRMQEQ